MTNFIDASTEDIARFADLSHEGPLHMLNLLRFRESAAYQEGESGRSGREAYAAYRKAAAPFFEAAGGEIIWQGVPLMGLIGPQDEKWDAGFIAHYPDRQSFFSMISDKGYQAILHHRWAALLDSRLYAFGQADLMPTGPQG